jgi:outer membrane murein-binding lipoprotein Lpp
VVVVTVLGGTFTAVFEAGRLHESVAELEPKVQQVQASVDALRADVRADVGALRADVRADVGALRADVRADFGALRADVRADFGALRVSSDKLNDKMDQLLLSFLPKSK